MVCAITVCPYDRLSQVNILLKWLNAGSSKQRHTTAQGLVVS